MVQANALEGVHERGKLSTSPRREAGNKVERGPRAQDGSNLGMGSRGMREESWEASAKGGVSKPAVKPESSMAAVGDGDKGMESEGGDTSHNAFPHGGVKLVGHPKVPVRRPAVLAMEPEVPGSVRGRVEFREEF